MNNLVAAYTLALLGLFGLIVSFGFWSKHRPSNMPFPPSIRFAAIGGWLALAGALCFAVAALLGD